MTRLVLAAAVLSLLLGCQGSAVAQDSAGQPTSRPALPATFDHNRYMTVAEVKLGMKGYGLSVFKGTAIERFEVEVLSVMRNFNPCHDVVLVRCSGANLEHTGSIAGMSGSPIFLKDEQGRERMIGAFAYGWPLMKDPVGGVQPIEYMLGIREGGAELTQKMAASAPAPKQTWTIDQAVLLPGMKQAPPAYPLARWNDLSPNPRLFAGDDQGDTTRLRPLATPLATAGASPRLVDKFGPLFKAYGLVPLQGGAATGASPKADDAVKLEPGSVLAVPLLTGDMELTAIGTCTEVAGGRVFGFGHSFNNEGAVLLPMGTGMIHSVIANLNTSFKLGALLKTTGTLTNDQMVGIAGRTGAAPPTVPLELRVVYSDGSIDQTYHFQATRHPRLTPLIAGFAISGALTGPQELPQYHTLDYDLTLKFADGQTLRVQNRDVNVDGGSFANELIGPIVAAAENPFERVLVSEIKGTMRVSPQAKSSRILSVTVPRTKYQPGDTVHVFVTHRPFRGDEMIMPVDIELPHDLPDGAYQLNVTDWQTYFSEERQLAPFRFTAENSKEVFALMREVLGVRHDALYLRLMRKPDGVAVGRVAMQHLPSSFREVLLGAGRSNVTPFVESTTKSIPTDYVMEGAAEFTLTIDRDLKTDTGKGPKHDSHPAEPKPKTTPDNATEPN